MATPSVEILFLELDLPWEYTFSFVFRGKAEGFFVRYVCVCFICCVFLFVCFFSSLTSDI